MSDDIDDLEEFARITRFTVFEHADRGARRPIGKLSMQTCVRGHPFDKENTRYQRKSGRIVRRICRTCARERQAIWAKSKAATE